jgi:hypothetical protein
VWEVWEMRGGIEGRMYRCREGEIGRWVDGRGERDVWERDERKEIVGERGEWKRERRGAKREEGLERRDERGGMREERREGRGEKGEERGERREEREEKGEGR